MTVTRGEVWPDKEFPDEVFGYHADRNSIHDYGTPFENKDRMIERIEFLKTDPNTYRLRLARYQLVEITELDCVGERPENNEN